MGDGAPQMSELVRERKTWSRLLNEFLGVFLLTLTATALHIATHDTEKKDIDVAFWGYTMSLLLMILVYTGMDVSGSAYNPAVTFAVWLMGLTSTNEAILYWFVQTLGGIAGAAASKAMFRLTYAVGPAPGYGFGSVFFSEFIFTGFLVFTVLSTVNPPALLKGQPIGNKYFGFAIGSVLMIAGAAVGKITGAYLNPAICFGIDVVSMHSLGEAKKYAVYELLGAAAGAFVYYLTHAHEWGSERISKFTAQLMCEFVGTWMLVLVIGCQAVGHSAWGAVAIGTTLSTLIYTMGPVSGGHFNPAVTFAVWLSGRGKISWFDAWKYMVCQASGALLGAWTYIALTGESISLGWKVKDATFPSGPGQAFFVELLFTFLLTSIVLACATLKENLYSNFFGLIIGFTVSVGGLAGGAESGGVFNPAVGFGIYFSHGPLLIYAFGILWLYFLAQFTAAWLSVEFFKFSHYEKEYASLDDGKGKTDTDKFYGATAKA